MKVRNILIGLLVVLMAFVFISCEDEPEEQVQPQPQPQPGPVDNTIYKLTATKGLSDGFYKYDKFVLDFNEEIYEGDTVSLLFRSSRDVYQVSIRSIDGSTKYVYEVGVDKEDKPYTLEDAGDGWTKLSYTFGEGVEADNFRVDLRLRTIVGDFVEIKNVFIGGKSISLTEENVDLETYGSVLPTFAETADHDWVTDPTYTVAYFTAKPHYEDDYPVMEAVIKGGKITKAGLSNDGYYIEKIEVISDFHQDGDMVLADFDPETSTIDADTNLLVTWKGVDRTVTFETNGAAPMEAKTVENGQLLVLTNEEQPERALYMFGGWYSDSTLETAFNLAVTPITSNITLYAKWILAANAKTVTIDLNTDCDLENLAAGDILANLVLEEGGFIDDENKPDADQYYPGFLFAGWYVGDSETPFDFNAAVNENVVVSARWTPGTLYRLVAKNNGSESLYSYDKIEVRQASASVSDGDVLSFRYRTTKMNTGFSIRKADNDKKWIYQNTDATHNYGLTTYEAKEDGWIYVTYKFDHTTAIDSSSLSGSGENYYLHFFNRYDEPTGNPGIEKGDILEIQGWAINNVPVAIVAGDVSGYAGATLSTIPEIDAGATPYAWTSHNVTFNYGDGTSVVPVEYGQKVDEPTDTEREGSIFVGWFADALFAEPFDFDTRIIDAVEVFAKYADPVLVTFELNGGVGVASTNVAEGEKLVAPEEPTRTNYLFAGWFTDELLLEEYDFDDPVTAPFTLYAKWVNPKNLTLNLNYEGAPAATIVQVESGAAITQPKNPGRVGFFFGGWYQEAGCENAFDFASGISVDTVIYAKWEEPTVAYKYAIYDTNGSSRFRWRFKSSKVALLSEIAEGDVVTVMVKFEVTSPLNNWKISTVSPSEQTIGTATFASMTPDANGWYSITAVVPEGVEGDGLYVQWYTSNSTWINNEDTCYVKGLAFNGVAIPLPGTGTEDGLNPGAKANVTAVNPTNLSPLE